MTWQPRDSGGGTVRGEPCWPGLRPSAATSRRESLPADVLPTEEQVRKGVPNPRHTWVSNSLLPICDFPLLIE